MLGALSLKWKWKERREADNLSTTRPNLVFGGDVHVVWEKFCRYFDVEPRIVPLEENKYTIGPEDVEPHLDENTIGVVGVLGTTFTGHMDDIVGINQLLLDVKEKRGLDIPIHVDGASGAFVWPFLYPDSQWDFRLEQVRSINVSGHKYGLVYPGIGWLIFRETSDLAQDLVFYENYLGKTDATFTLNFSTGASMVLAQYYNFVRLGRDGYTYVMKQMQQNAQALAANLRDSGRFEVIGDDAGAAPARGVPARGRARVLRRVRHRLAAVGRARLDGAGVHPPAQRREGEDHARAGQGDHEPRAGRAADPRHRRRLRDPRREGRDAPDRTRADQDGHRLLTVASATRRGRRASASLAMPGPRWVRSRSRTASRSAEEGRSGGTREGLSATRSANSWMSGSDPKAAALRTPSTFMAAHCTSELPYEEGAHRRFLSVSSSRVASTYPVSAAPKQGNPARTGCSVIDSGRQMGSRGGFFSPSAAQFTTTALSATRPTRRRSRAGRGRPRQGGRGGRRFRCCAGARAPTGPGSAPWPSSV